MKLNPTFKFESGIPNIKLNQTFKILNIEYQIESNIQILNVEHCF